MPTITQNIPNTTFIASALPNNNFSFYPLMNVGTDPGFQDCIGLLQLTLPELPVEMVDRAELELAVIVKSGTAPSTVVVNRVTSPFTTETVAYSTAPSYVATSLQAEIRTADLYQTVKIDITGLVNAWLGGVYPNYGIALTNSDGTTEVQFGTDHIVYEPYFPKLTVTYGTAPSSTALCFAYAQLANVIRQLITMYPENVMTVYTTGFGAVTITGTPYELFTSPDGTYGGLFVLLDGGQQEAIPLNAITAIYTGDGTVYNPAITYLPTPKFPAGCDTNLITAIHDYLPVSTEVQLYMGSVVQASGAVFKDEYGLLVLSDGAGNTPIFIPVINITVALPLPPVPPAGLEKSTALQITVNKEAKA